MRTDWKYQNDEPGASSNSAAHLSSQKLLGSVYLRKDHLSKLNVALDSDRALATCGTRLVTPLPPISAYSLPVAGGSAFSTVA